MEEPFIYKYQPKTLDKLELKPALLRLIKSLIQTHSLTIMFIGPNGCGKTTLLNAILADYYKHQDFRNNVLTINTLYDQGVGYYRSELKTFCQTACSISGYKKTLILDDLDNINEQSQQIFRHCIDKYSKDVNFIATCTNAQKVIDSLQSRFTMLQMESLTMEKIKKTMFHISKLEGINIDDEAIIFITTLCNKSMKMMLNYLEKFKLMNTHISINLAMEVCTNISFIELEQYTCLCKSYTQIKEAIKLIYSILERGYSIIDIFDTYFQFIKYTDKVTEEEKYKIIPLICKYISTFNQTDENTIELALFTNNLISILSSNILYNECTNTKK